jgi:hypothetical protein
MQQSCTYGSVRGASGNRRPYRDTNEAVLGRSPEEVEMISVKP